MHPAFERYLTAREAESAQIPSDRKRVLERLGYFVASRVRNGEPARLTFVCTHNARRSQLAQVVALGAARRYGLGGVEAFSGGTQVTAVDARVVVALRRAGLRIRAVTDPPNSTYEVDMGDPWPPLSVRSKAVEDPINPASRFCAVMTCSDADAACPTVPGADLRLAIPYDDPKRFAGSPAEAERYDERCRQIAREMVYATAIAAGGKESAACD